MEHCVKTGEKLVLTPVLITREVAKRAHKYGWISTLAYNKLIHNNETESRVTGPIVSNVTSTSEDDDTSTQRTMFNRDNFKESKMSLIYNSVDRKCKETHSNLFSSSRLQAQKEKETVNNEIDSYKETCLEICADEERILLHGSFDQESCSVVIEKKMFQTSASDTAVEPIENILEQNQKVTSLGNTKTAWTSSSSENMAELEDEIKTVDFSPGAAKTETHFCENSGQEVICEESENNCDCRDNGDVFCREKFCDTMLSRCENAEMTVQGEENVSENDENYIRVNTDIKVLLQDLEKQQNKESFHLQNDTKVIASDQDAKDTDNEQCHKADDDKSSNGKTTEMEKDRSMGVTEDTKALTQTLSNDIMDSLQKNIVDNVYSFEAVKAARPNCYLESKSQDERSNMSREKLKKLLKVRVLEGILDHPVVQEHLKELELYKKKLSDLEKENCRLEDDTKNLKATMRKLCYGIVQKNERGTQVDMDLELNCKDNKLVSSSDFLREDVSSLGRMSNSVENGRVVKKELQGTVFSDCLSSEVDHESCQPSLNQSRPNSPQSLLWMQEHLVRNKKLSVMQRHQHGYPNLQQPERFSQEHRYQQQHSQAIQQQHQQVFGQHHPQVIQQHHQQGTQQQNQQVIQQQHPQVIQQQHQQVIQQQNQQVIQQQHATVIDQQHQQGIQHQHSQVIQQQHPLLIRQQHQQAIHQQNSQIIQQQYQQMVQQQQSGNLKRHHQEYPQLYQQQNLLRQHQHRGLFKQHPQHFLQHKQGNPQQFMLQHQQHLNLLQSTPQNGPLQFQCSKASSSYSNGPFLYNMNESTKQQLGESVEGASPLAGSKMYSNHIQSLNTQPLNMIGDPSSKIARLQSSESADIDRNVNEFNRFLKQQLNHGSQDPKFKTSPTSCIVLEPPPANIASDGTREFYNASQTLSTGVSMPTPPLTPLSTSPFVVEGNLVNSNISASVTATGDSSFTRHILHSPPVFTDCHNNRKPSHLKRSSIESRRKTPLFSSSSNSLPPRLIVSVELKQGVVVLSWNVSKVPLTPISKYEIYAHLDDGDVGETDSRPWKLISTMSPAPLPMSCSLIEFEAGCTYYFVVRSIDIYGQMGSFSFPTKVTVRVQE